MLLEVLIILPVGRSPWTAVDAPVDLLE